MATGSASKILVHIKRSKQSPLVRAAFDTCLLEQLGFGDEDALTCEVHCFLQDNQLVLQNFSEEDEEAPISKFLLKHPPFCPFVEISYEDRRSFTDDTLDRGVNVGVSVILEAKDQKILLTRRARHMRTFPGVWVPPGGHIELNETLEEAGLRELHEETGLQIPSSIKKRSSVLALWESVFPPILSFGQPSRHHVVVYWFLQVDRTSSQLEKDMKLSPDEVDASFWMPLELTESIVAGVPFKLETLKKYQYMSVDQNGEQSYREMDPETLRKKMPSTKADNERISTGTRFAIEMWWKKRTLPSCIQTQKSNL